MPPRRPPHGHAHLDGLAKAPVTRAALAARVARQRGSSPAFHCCDGHGLNLDELLERLPRCGKIVGEGGAGRTARSPTCAHD